MLLQESKTGLMRKLPDRSDTEPFHRRFALAGVIVGAVAIFGVDLAFAMKQTGKHPRTHAAVVRLVSSADAAALGAAPVAAVTVLALMLWLGRRSTDPIPLSLPTPSATVPADIHVETTTRARFSISYHTGGLYGP